MTEEQEPTIEDVLNAIIKDLMLHEQRLTEVEKRVDGIELLDNGIDDVQQ